jgi:hypothetical protein
MEGAFERRALTSRLTAGEIMYEIKGKGKVAPSLFKDSDMKVCTKSGGRPKSTYL